jgi:hypothetical protein
MWTHPVAKLLKNLALMICPFFFWANSQGAEIIAGECGDSSPSIGELWTDIDKLDEIPREDTTVMHVCDASVHRRRSTASVENASRHEVKRTH